MGPRVDDQIYILTERHGTNQETERFLSGPSESVSTENEDTTSIEIWNETVVRSNFQVKGLL